ncbi:beta-ketoacyl synthase N-terminal-like domain-containing protein [Sutcliffiella rhizosphaerae]|uniref:Beta-ketoacyl synthase-like N-terminal domain-containing protein n=1 Tax=Sutcliffiella rhizosphaerae TaxID=2880967 RepID=A0ABN8AGN5_9BACI|nr:beta-ketoacyl synthase N-terminal-like domain-containing protein [Sutcliffiella rhizosphaerae]CAG9623399.1 hypothetical protein BACCIP111883_04210 [Sutcliffiella rhizosphaerae]
MCLQFISGYNVITSMGIGLNKLIGNNIEEFNMENFNKINLDIDLFFNKHKRLPYETRLACYSMESAFSMMLEREDDVDRINLDEIGIIVATTYTNLKPIKSLIEEAKEYGINKINPAIFPNTVLNSISGHAAINLGVKGANITISQGDKSGQKALDYALDILQCGILERVIVCEVNLNIQSDDLLKTSNSIISSINESISTIVIQNKPNGEAGHFCSETFNKAETKPNAVLQKIYELKNKLEIGV